ncbi:transglycosylase protein with SLT domain [Nocardioides albertanoniae]|uniref:Transglycosylase protein with SLT domain n=1 Tax=Nocardioides albertanoniae TaxID=1175486 RepID=A0A543ADJ4_9ACTN|nr:lytic transglycosylase domain-containing protein [Nocardioides albertanoniae]TQL70657.1 transglycosylase protein with SLT domain [Nocardioides albertanoniae]
MSASRYSRLQKATALVPLALLSAAWTVNVTGLTQSSATASGTTYNDAFSLPDGTSVPAEAIEAPASVSASTNKGDDGKSIAGSANAAGIPSAALSAYQRAATVINAADATCKIDWPLIAAIGRVESNHGRANDNRLSAEGISTPGIFGLPLNGKGNVAQITDTDGGQYDGDTDYDRAVGPMQFIPSTWAMVGVDADGDGKRNPQDINDSALATAVYLCSGPDNLSTDQGARKAVFRYNHSQAYVSTVLGVAEAYRSGDFTSIPNSTVPADYAIPKMDAPGTEKQKGRELRAGGKQAGPRGGASHAPSSPGDAPADSKPGGGDAGSPGGGGDNGGDDGTTDPAKPLEPVTKPVEKIAASTDELLKICTDAFAKKYPGMLGVLSGPIQTCVNQLATKTVPEALGAVGGVLGGLVGVINNILTLGLKN